MLIDNYKQIEFIEKLLSDTKSGALLWQHAGGAGNLNSVQIYTTSINDLGMVFLRLFPESEKCDLSFDGSRVNLEFKPNEYATEDQADTINNLIERLYLVVCDKVPNPNNIINAYLNMDLTPEPETHQ